MAVVSADENLPPPIRLIAGTSLYACAGGLVAVSPEGLFRIDLGSREFEQQLVALLSAGADPSPLSHRFGAPATTRALAALQHAGVLGPALSTQRVDLLGRKGSEPSTSLAANRTLAIAAHLFDPRLGDYLERARALALPVVAVWTVGAKVTAAVSEPASRPCVQCALLFDAEGRQPRLGDAVSTLIASAVAAGDFSRSSDVAVGEIAAGLLSRLAEPGSERPTPGRALSLDTRTWTSTWERYSAHPSCPCALASAPEQGVMAEHADWATIAGRRFAPVICADPGSTSQPARVFYRRAHSLWPASPGQFGIASAFGEQAQLRALGESVERFSMFHAPPDVRNIAASRLSEPTLDDALLRSLLYRPQERSAPGFRHVDYDSELALDWSWAHEVATGQRALVPTCLVGEPQAGPRLLDTTSNGYAAHLNRAKAIELALLELVERDAVLLSWYLQLETPRIHGLPPGRPGVHAYLATRDVALPVVLLVATLPLGGLRCACAARTSFNEALDGALRELDSALASPRPGDMRTPEGALRDPRAREGPSNHLRYYLDKELARPVLERMEAQPKVSAESLRLRWPVTATQTAAAALAAAGLSCWVVDRSLPRVFGPRWAVVRALVPGLVEISWGDAYRRLASPRVAAALARGATLCHLPHPIA